MSDQTAVPKTAIVHEWFDTYAGSERCVESFVRLFPDADIFSLVDFLSDADRELILNGKHANTTFIQKLPFARKKFRNYLPLFPFAVEQHNLTEYDLVLSSSHSVAKGALTFAHQLHICYCHTPVRYAWDMYHQYLSDAGLTRGLKSWIAKYALHKIRQWDAATAGRVDYFIANSHFVAQRIKKNYGRDAAVIHPPVDVDRFPLKAEKEDYYITASRMVPYKRIDLVAEAFTRMPDKKLVIAGDGPELAKIEKIAAGHKNITLAGYLPHASLVSAIQSARAFVFAAEEDFGIMPVEAMATGTPVIAFGRGGALDSVRNGVSGCFFTQQTAASVMQAVQDFEKMTFDPQQVRAHAEQFSRPLFQERMQRFIQDKYTAFRGNK